MIQKLPAAIDTFVKSSKPTFMLPIKTTLLVNGLSSGATGVALIAFSNQAAKLFEVSQVSPFVYTGIFLLLFALFVISTGMKKNIKQGAIKFITSLDILWVVASIALVVIDGSYISSIGNVLVIAVAAWVALMALLQSKGLKHRERLQTARL